MEYLIVLTFKKEMPTWEKVVKMQREEKVKIYTEV